MKESVCVCVCVCVCMCVCVSVCVCVFIVCSLLLPSRVGRTWVLSSECTDLILQVGCTSYHLTLWRKSALMQCINYVGRYQLFSCLIVVGCLHQLPFCAVLIDKLLGKRHCAHFNSSCSKKINKTLEKY